MNIPGGFSASILLNRAFSGNFPEPGCGEELRQFHQLQEDFTLVFKSIFTDFHTPKSVIVIPSLTLDQDVLLKIDGAIHYEERLLCLLMLLRMPGTHVTFVSSIPIDPAIIDYYLHLLPGITGLHAKERLTLIDCNDPSPVPLTLKILQRKRIMDRIRKSIPAGHPAHIACFNTSPMERTLAVRLGIPIYGCDPTLNHLGSKSGCRLVFLKAGVPIPHGVENLHSYEEIVHAISALKDMYPNLKKVLIKLNEGFSGDGNALLTYPEHLDAHAMFNWIHHNLYEFIKPVAKDITVDKFLEKFKQMGGIVEAFIEGDEKHSPSVQCRITPLGDIELVSTHDQVLGGESGQVFIGAHFPANNQYRNEITRHAFQIAEVLKKEGVTGRFSIDFISVKTHDEWHHHAIEINLRKGGTTHPYLMLQFLTNGMLDIKEGTFITPAGLQRCYYTSDNLQKDAYRGLVPKDLIDIAMFHGLHFDAASQKGVMFHMIGALSQFGKMGIVCIGESRDEAYAYYLRTIEVLDAETS